MSFNKKAIIETVKEVARIAFFGAVSAVISYATTRVANLPPDSVYAIVLTVVLRGIDKFVHESPDIKANGISPL